MSGRSMPPAGMIQSGLSPRATLAALSVRPEIAADATPDDSWTTGPDMVAREGEDAD